MAAVVTTTNGAMAKRPKEAYALAPSMERVIATLASCRPRFWGRLGAELDDECFTDLAARLALKAARAVAKDGGRGPDSTVLVVQRLRRWMSEGKLTLDDIEDVVAMFDEVEDGGLPAEEAVITEVAPVIKRRLEREAVDAMLSAFQKKGDLEAASGIITRANRVGQTDASPGQRHEDASSALARLRNLKKLPTGILELDDLIAGGTVRGTLALWVASTGGGKSMGLIQNATSATLRKKNVAYATLELSEEYVLARYLANLTGLETDAIIEDTSVAQYQLDEMVRLGLGDFVVKKFTPKVTTPRDIFAWVRDLEERTGRRYEVLVVDYADKLTARGSKASDDRDNSYVESGDVYEDLRVWCESEARWGWTASQAQRNKDKKAKKLDTDDVADSLNKSRVVDYLISINPRDENQNVILFVSKARHGKSQESTPPLPTLYECARLAPVNIPEDFAL